MGSVQHSFWYCCASKGGQILYSYNRGGDPEIENLGALCLEMTPPYHRWYLETRGRKTVGFLMDDGYVYLAIVNDSVGSARVLWFLDKLREELRRKVGRRGSASSLQELLLPVVRDLVASSLQNNSSSCARGTKQEWLSHSPTANDSKDSGKAPLLGRSGSSRQDKRKMKDQVVITVEMEEGKRSGERGGGIMNTCDSGVVDSNNNLQERKGNRSKASSQNLQRKWCRQVRIILAIDAAVCLVLFAVWLIICRGLRCIR